MVLTLVNTLKEHEFINFIENKMEEKETKVIMNKRLVIKAKSEFQYLFLKFKISLK